MALRVITTQEIDQLLSMSEAIEANIEAYIEWSLGQAIVPQRIRLDTPAGINLFMPAFMKSNTALAFKVVTIYGQNPSLGLPTIHGLVLVIDSQTGRPAAMMEGMRLTALRTGAGAGAATSALALPNAELMGLFGAGGQARDQVRAVLAVREIRQVNIYTPSGKSARKLADRLSGEYPDVTFRAVSRASEAAGDADIITCVTTSREPVFDPHDIKPGCHINGVGSFTPEMKEVPVFGLKGLKIFVDSRSAVLEEAGELIEIVANGQTSASDLIEIGSVLSGASPGRTGENDITFFKSVGLAAQDATTAQAILKKAEAIGVGTLLEF